jgi:hypothetical protein
MPVKCTSKPTKDVSAAMNQQTTIEELLEIMFSMWSLLGIHEEVTRKVKSSEWDWVSGVGVDYRELRKSDNNTSFKPVVLKGF